ncbi:MAG: D-alanyl-D-alanine carboxypeptidase, partial [Telluria sp.]
MKKLIVALAASLLTLSASAQTVPAPQIAAKSWLLLDATSGQVIAA